MTKAISITTALTTLVAVSLMLVSAAFAGHNGAVVSVDEQACSATTISATITDPNGTHDVDNMYLVVDDGDSVQYQIIPTDGSSADITVGPFSENATVNWNVFGGGERSYDQPLWNGFGGATFSSDISAYAASQGGSYSWVIAGVDDPNPLVNWNEVEVGGCEPQKATGGITAAAGGVDLQLNFNAHQDIKGVKGNVKYSNSLGGNFKGDINVCYNQEGKEAAFVGEITEGTYNAQYFKIEVQDIGNGNSGDPDRIRVLVSNTEYDCSLSGSFPGVRTEGNLVVHSN